MVIDYKELKNREFSLSNIKVILQEPSYRSLVQKSRLFNGFLYIIDGGCRYAFDGGEFYAGEGSLIYLPFGSKHTMTAYGERFRFYRVDFTIRIKKEIALFSEIPIKITDNAPPADGQFRRGSSYFIVRKTFTAEKEKLLILFIFVPALNAGTVGADIVSACRDFM